MIMSIMRDKQDFLCFFKKINRLQYSLNNKTNTFYTESNTIELIKW